MEREITFDIVCCKLNELYQLIPGRGFTGGSRLKNISLPGEIPFRRDFLYILDYQTFQKYQKQLGRCPLILTNCPEHLEAEGNLVHTADPFIAAGELFRETAALFANFYEWRESLHDFDQSSRTISSLLEKSAVFMNANLTVTDPEYRSALASRTEEWNSRQTGEKESDNIRELKSILNTQPEFAESFHTRGVQPYPNPYSGLMYYYNIFHEKEYLARIVATFPEQPFFQGMVRLFSYLAPFVERAYLRYHQNRNPLPDKTRLLNLLKTLLEGKPLPDSLTLLDTLDHFGWQAQNCYQVIQLALDEYGGNTISRGYFCAQFSQTFPSCIAFQLDGRILAVRNLSAEPPDMDFDRDFPCFLRDNLCRAGVSRQAAGIHRLRELALEARDAMAFGRQKNSTFWCWHFSDYTLDYLKAHMVRQYSADQLEHPALALLREYDRQNRSSLYPTLEMYVRQRFSASAAAAALYIHRSTFLHRLDRIQTLAKLDFTDEKLRLWLTLSFFISASENR